MSNGIIVASDYIVHSSSCSRSLALPKRRKMIMSESAPTRESTDLAWSKMVGPLKRCQSWARSCVSGAELELSVEVVAGSREGSGESNPVGSEVGNGAGGVGSGGELRSRRLGETATRGSTSLKDGVAAAGPKRLATSLGGGGESSGSIVGLRAGVRELAGGAAKC